MGKKSKMKYSGFSGICNNSFDLLNSIGKPLFTDEKVQRIVPDNWLSGTVHGISLVSIPLHSERGSWNWNGHPLGNCYIRTKLEAQAAALISVLLLDPWVAKYSCIRHGPIHHV